MYLRDEKQRRRIIEVVERQEGLECPELVVNDIFEGVGQAVVNYTCREGEPSRDLRLSKEEAVYVGLDRSAWRAPPETL